MRNTPSRISASTFPIAAAATAPAYDFPPDADEHDVPVHEINQGEPGQQPLLFKSPIQDSRVIPFDSLTTRAERQSMRARAAGLDRPAPLKTEKVEIKHARRAKMRGGMQRTLEFQGQDTPLPQPQSNIICDAMVAPTALRMQAAMVDLLVMLLPCLAGLLLFWYVGGEFSTDKHVLPLFLIAFATVPFFYKLLWTMAGVDTIGMRYVGLLLVDFDGNPPSRARRYQRFFGGFLSFLAAGIGLVWSLVDEDRLTWHDHISSTFPTVVDA